MAKRKRPAIKETSNEQDESEDKSTSDSDSDDEGIKLIWDLNTNNRSGLPVNELALTWKNTIRNLYNVIKLETKIFEKKVSIEKKRKEVERMEKTLVCAKQLCKREETKMDDFINDKLNKGDKLPVSSKKSSSEGFKTSNFIDLTKMTEIVDPVLETIYDQMQLFPESSVVRDKLYRYVNGIDEFEHRSKQLSEVSESRIVDIIVQGYVDVFLFKIFTGEIHNSDHNLFVEGGEQVFDILDSNHNVLYGPVSNPNYQEQIQAHCEQLGRSWEASVLSDNFSISGYIKKVMIRNAIIQALAIDREVEYEVAEQIYNCCEVEDTLSED